MSAPLDALAFLQAKDRSAPPVCVVYGDEPFLKREVIEALRHDVLGEGEGAFGLTVVGGRDAELRDVVDELATVSLFGDDRRMVLVEEADDFVRANRERLEAYVERPASGVLVLEVRSWPRTTRLAKAVAGHGLTVECKRPKAPGLKKWLKHRAQARHGAKLSADAAELLVERVGAELGLLDQELARLSVLGDPPGTISDELVRTSVGGWRTRTTWEMIDAAADGNAVDAIAQLERLIVAGEHPIAVLGPLASTLRRFAFATRLVVATEQEGRRPNLRGVLKEAGFKPFVLEKAERQLRQIGRPRGRRLAGWLLEADLAMKGTSSSPQRARLELEKLIVRLARI